MFDEKFKRINFRDIKQHIKKIEFFSKIFHQSKIIIYFRFAINQDISINQNSKTSNSKNYRQHTFAKSNRIKFIFNKWFEKSIISLYKLSTFSRHLFVTFISKISSISSYKMLVISDRSIQLSISRFAFNIFVFSFVCRICNDICKSNNDLHRHLRTIHFNHDSRHNQEKFRTHDRNLIDFWKKLRKWWKNKSFFCFLLCIINRFLMNESHVFATRHNENVVIFFRWWHLLR